MNTRAHVVPGLTMLGLLLIVAVPAAGRTWTVEKDGTGDFWVIQDAVDAASDGDVIEIGPGRYEEYQTVQGGSIWFDVHVLIPENTTLTFVGAGAESTIIGPEDAEVHSNRTYGFAASYDVSLTFHNISIENCNMFSIEIGSGSVDVQNCRFYYGSDFTTDTMGLRGGFTGGAQIRNCRFEGLYKGISSIDSPGGVQVENCEFVDCRSGFYAWTTGSSNIRLTDSFFECGVIGFTLAGGAGGEVQRCTLRNCVLSLPNSGVVTITDCLVSRDDGGYALSLANTDPVALVNNIFESNGIVAFVASYGLGTFRDNHFLRTGDDYWIISPSHPSFNQDVDFSGNWWGTTDIEEISEGIWDCYDEPDTYNCVIFEPIADGPVPVESHTWSEVKGMFR